MIEDVRTALIADLEPLGVPVHGPWPGRVTPPCAIVGIEPTGYVGKGQTFQSFTLGMTVVLLVVKKDGLAALDPLIELALTHTQADWGLTRVDVPTTFIESGVEILGTTLHISKQSKL